MIDLVEKFGRSNSILDEKLQLNIGRLTPWGIRTVDLFINRLFIKQLSTISRVVGMVIAGISRAALCIHIYRRHLGGYLYWSIFYEVFEFLRAHDLPSSSPLTLLLLVTSSKFPDLTIREPGHHAAALATFTRERADY